MNVQGSSVVRWLGNGTCNSSKRFGTCNSGWRIPGGAVAVVALSKVLQASVNIQLVKWTVCNASPVSGSAQSRVIYVNSQCNGSLTSRGCCSRWSLPSSASLCWSSGLSWAKHLGPRHSQKERGVTGSGLAHTVVVEGEGVVEAGSLLWREWSL